MSPEQIKGARNVDVRTDIWALGVMLHEVLAGQLPFKGATVADHFVQVATSDPTPLAIAAPHAPSAMARIVAKCLRRSPSQRYPDAGTLLLDLRAVAAEARSDKSFGPSSAARERQEAVTADPAPAQDAHHRGEGATASLELALPPSRTVARTVSIRPLLADAGGRRLAASGAVALAAVAGAGLLAMINPLPDDWALAPWTTSLMSDSGTPVAYGVAVVFVAAAVRIARTGWLRDPRSWGHFIASLGALGIAIVIVAATTGQAPWSLLPTAAALGAVGVAAVALRGATDAWLGELRTNAVALTAGATAALFVARQLIR